MTDQEQEQARVEAGLALLIQRHGYGTLAREVAREVCSKYAFLVEGRLRDELVEAMRVVGNRMPLPEKRVGGRR